MSSSPSSKPPRNVAVMLYVLAALAAALLAAGRGDYPELHTVLDTGMFLLSGVLALLLWDMGERIGNPFPKQLAVAFACASAVNLVHVLVTVEWSGPLLPIAQARGLLRPVTWPLGVHVLPLGVAGALWALQRRQSRSWPLAPALLAVGALCYLVVRRLPPYAPPSWLGVTRPALMLPPLLWLAVGWRCWRLREEERLLPMLALTSLVLASANAVMLYSRAPHDAQAMAAHLLRVGGFLLLLVSIMRMAASDMRERIRAEQELERLNRELERRVLDRTARLEASERKAQDQLGRLNLLHQITRATGERQDIHSIFQVVIRSLEDDLPIDFSCICLYDPAAHSLKVVRVGVKSAPTALELAMAEQATIPIDENGLSRCVRGQLVYEPDISEVPFPFPQRLARGGLRSLVAAPLLVESQVFGVLVAARRQPRSFVSGECEFLKQLSEHVALASHQSQLYGALQQAYDDLRQTQQAVMQQERLRALGQMASGIAHDINNAISPVSLYAESLLETEKGLSARGRGYLETIGHAIEDVAQTVARMREFYRQREPQLSLAPVSVNRLAQQVVDLTRARWNDMPQQRGVVIKMTTDLPPELPLIMGVESEIREALINLVFNGVDAMPEGGVLAIRTAVVEAAPARAGAPAARSVQVEVSDSGMGMAEDTRRRCLEPFFTTKGERGTGLGLAMVYGMVKRHSADIEIESAVGRGTTVRLSFAVPSTPVLDAGKPARALPPRMRILVVDDDPLLIKSLRDILEVDGHTVVAAAGGRAGIDAFLAAQGAAEAFAAVITDLGMPYVDGRKVAGAVKAASPGTPVILLTGWGQRLVDEGDIPPHVDRVLSKPPKLHELRAALAEVAS